MVEIPLRKPTFTPQPLLCLFRNSSSVKEPEHLNEEATAILEQTQDLAFTNYKTFIQTAECSREIFRQFKNTEKRLDDLVRKLPEFSEKCQKFSRASNDINLHRRLNSLTMTRNAQLLEILELPQLMDTCIRSDQYEEALELAAYVRRLGKRYGHIPIIASIARDVEAAWLNMLYQLLSQLHTDLQLPKCLQVVGYLRRMGLFTEPELRLKFLQARDTWLHSLLAAIPKDDGLLCSILIYSGTIFYNFKGPGISQFLVTLEQDLSHVGGGSLDSLIGQCMYFGLSFSRVGADFRGLIAPIFIRTVSQNFELAVKRATKKLEQDMKTFTLAKTAKTQSMFVRGAAQKSKQDEPPQSLLEFFPLAEYCNNLMAAFNDVRLCAPVAVADTCTQLLQESLCAAAQATLSFYRQEQQAFLPVEKEAFTRLCVGLGKELVPYVQRCIHLVFPPATIAQHLGISTQQLQREGVTYLNQTSILGPINHLFPVTIELPPPVTNTISTESDNQTSFSQTEVL
ncbi:hypothetical protein PR048_031557 [Dryococelus australis]|uniref:Conserved oligomeric Golgi complex subunit 8 n=1 Tax=Dryococelus australis TaxID=614101 RepID=A0ABQ9G5M9_9NEOP|nr:hypothetical protein PR048_031557 [Dryococelus australis]